MSDIPPFFLIAWGGRQFHLHGLLAARSLLSRGARDITIYTDNPGLFPAPLSTVVISATELRALRGKLDFCHRAKIELTRRHVATRGLPCVFVDSDTYCEELPAITTDETRTLMHNDDGLVSPAFYPRLHRFLAASLGVFHRAGFPMVTASFPMFNSGGIYFPQRAGTAEDLSEVLRLSDLACRHFPEQIEWLEQFAFTQILGTRGALSAMPRGITHYWGMNFEVSHLLGRLDAAAIVRMAEEPERFHALLEEARALAVAPEHRWRIFVRRQRRSYRKRLTMFRAWRLTLATTH